MCELFAISSEKPVDLRFSLNRLARRGGREAQNCDGWGLAAYEDCDVYLSVGTSSEVFPAAGLFDIARAAGAVTVEINPNATEQTANFDFVLSGKSGSVLPELLESVFRPNL